MSRRACGGGMAERNAQNGAQNNVEVAVHRVLVLVEVPKLVVAVDVGQVADLAVDRLKTRVGHNVRSRAPTGTHQVWALSSACHTARVG